MKCQRKSPLCVLLAAVLTLALAACGSTNTAENTPTNTSRMPADVKTFTYERDGLRLLISAGYNDLVTVDTDPAGALFSVSEKASIEAAKALGEDVESAGWLFNIATADADELKEILRGDMSGIEPFAKDADGQYYLFCTPTDVRVVREDYDDPDSLYEWELLNEWASTVPDAFLNDNPDLVPVSDLYDDESDESYGFTGEEFVGGWMDAESQRAMLSITETDEPGVYDVLIHWSGSYNTAMQWRMKAVAATYADILSYENGQKVEVMFPDDGVEQETVIWDDGAGYFWSDEDGHVRWSDEQEEAAEGCLFVKD